MLAKHLSAAELVDAFKVFKESIRAHFAALKAAQDEVNRAFDPGGSWPSIRIYASDRYHSIDFNEKAAIEAAEHDAWRVIIDRLEIRRAMSSEDWSNLESQLAGRHGQRMPPISHESIDALRKQFAMNLNDTFNRAVKEVFDWLRPRENTWHANYKTNRLDVVGERVIITGCVERSNGKWHVCYYSDQRVRIIENVFNVLDGQGFASKGYYSDLENAIRESADGTGETKLFAFRCFRNRNLHLRFKRLDLLAEFNRRAGGINLAA